MAPRDMLVIQQEEFGPPEVMRLVEAERPEPGPAEVLVEVLGAGVNPVDWKVRSGYDRSRRMPLTVGWDVSGIVREVGGGVTRFEPGDEVYGMPRFPADARAYATFVTSPSRQLAHKPRRLDHLHAGGLPLAGLTAWQLLVDTADVQPGQRVLINAAAGGVGHLAVQIATARSAHVIAVARSGKHVALREMGADETIDYTEVDPVDEVGDLDVVVDGSGGPDTTRWLPTLRPGGLLLPLTGADDDAVARAADQGVRLRRLLVEPDGHELELLAALVDEGRLEVRLDTVFPLARAADAHAQGEQGRTFGKIVLDPTAAAGT